MKNAWKVMIILGISAIAWICKLGAGFTIAVLLIYLEFIHNQKEK